jgi:hypothetical protein
MRWLTDAEYATVMQQAATPDAKRAIASTVAAADGVKVEPLALAGKAPSKPPVVAEEEDEEVAPPPPKAKKAKPAPVAAVEEDEAEPEVRKPATKATAVPAKKGSLSSIVADWDDE